MGGVETDLDGRTSVPDSSRPARWRAPACTAPTGWPATRCSRGSCSARAPRRRCTEPPRAAVADRAGRAAGCTSSGRRGVAAHRRRRCATSCGGTPAWCATDGCRTPWRVCEAWRAARRGPRTRHRVDRELRRVASLVTVGFLIARAALRREESRGGHFRADFPHRDDIHWQKHFADVLRAAIARSANRQLPTPNSRWPNRVPCWELDVGRWELTRHPHVERDRHPRSSDRNHAPVPGLRPLVHRRRPPRRAGRLLAGQGLHGHPARTATRSGS